MLVAFDLDGTITRNPSVFLALARALKNSKHSIIILTAAAGEIPKDNRPAEVAKRLRHIGWGEFETSIRCCESCEKPAICKQIGADILIDDSDFVLNGTIQLKVI